MGKFTIIGAGSTYTPELIEGLNRYKDSISFDEIMLYDINQDRLEIMYNFVQRYAHKLGYKTNFTKTASLIEAVQHASFVNTQIRVGGNESRYKDEIIPLHHGLIGQETTGAGGFMKALRTIPVMLEIAKAVEKYAPNCWIINYTNPTGLVTEAITTHTNAKIAGFCSGGIFPKMWSKKALHKEYPSVQYNYIGLNHMNFTYDLKFDGTPATPEELFAVAKQNDAIDLNLVKLLNCIPSPYLQYYYHTDKKYQQLKQASQTRAQEVMSLEQEIYKELQDPNSYDKPKSLSKRGGGGYSEVAIGFVNAIYNNIDTEMIVNTPNNGAIPYLPDNAVVEVNCMVNRNGIVPLVKKDPPKSVWGLIAAVKNYEQLAVEAAVKGDYNTAKLALLAHPLVHDYEKVEVLISELFQANKDYLSQFTGL